VVGYSEDGISWILRIPTGIAQRAGAAFRSVAWNGLMFVMVGANSALTPTATGYFSYDASNWTITNIFGTSTGASGFGICWNGLRWVAVGRNLTPPSSALNTMNTSSNGFVWNTVSSTNSNNFNGIGGQGAAVCWNGTKFIAVGRDRSTSSPIYTVLYSYDTLSWMNIQIGGVVPSNTNPFYTSGSVTGGIGNGIAYNSVRTNQIIFPRNIMVGVGSYGTGIPRQSTTIAYSTDGGLGWNAGNGIFNNQTSPSFTNSIGYCVAFNGRIWLAGGLNSVTSPSITMAYSFSGMKWTAVPNSPNIFSSSCRGIAWSPVLNLWVAVGEGIFNLAYSYDGITWTVLMNTFDASGYCVSWGGNKFVAGGGGNINKLIYSYNGIDWIKASITVNSSINAVGFNGTIWVAVGNNSNNSGIFYSYDGIDWTVTPSSNITNKSDKGGVAWSSVLNIWIASVDVSVNTLYYSNDGIYWTGATGTPPSSPPGSGLGVSWTGNRFVMGYSTTTATVPYTSINGINWSANSGGSLFSPFYTLYNSAWSFSVPNSGEELTNVSIQQPVLAFGSGTNTIAYSYDGIVWRGLGKSVFTTTGYCGCWNGNLWVAGGVSSGVGVLAYSYDGINWKISSQTILSTIIWSIAWNGTVFVAVGEGTSPIAYSYNGITWFTPAVLPSDFLTGYCVAWGQNYFVVGGSGSTNNYAYSTNGINWTGGVIGNSGFIYRSVICGGSLWVIVGNNGTTSSVGYWSTTPTVSWTPGSGFAGGTGSSYYSLTFGIYPVSSDVAGTTYGTIFFAGGLTINPSTSACIYSTDGKTWTTSASGNIAFNNVQLNSLVWNGKRFIGISGTSETNTRIAYSYDAQTWYSIPSSFVTKPLELFTTAGYGLATSAWPTLGSVYIDNALTLSSTSGLNTNNQLDVYSDTYFNNGFSNMSVKINSTPIS
jgi:hypothetical protein